MSHGYNPQHQVCNDVAISTCHAPPRMF